jgi:hypothetical protein
MISKLLKQIRQKRQRAKRAGLEIISTEKLALIALASPHWREIGSGKDKYHFCRRDHSQGYTAENTFIGPSEENIKERNKRCGLPNGSECLPALTDRAERQRQQNAAWQRDPKNRALLLAKERRYRAKKKAAAAGKAATASNSTPMNINLGEEHDVEQNKI